MEGIVSASCGNTHDSAKQLIRSPNYPSYYGHYVNCNWKITSPFGDPVTLQFNDFKTEPVNDKLLVFDGPDPSSTLAFTFYGILSIYDFHSTGDSVYLEFISDYDIEFPGFEIHYFWAGNEILH